MNETESLQGLVQKARRDRGTSIRQLAFKAQEAGFKIVGTTLNAIEKGTYKSVPSDETIRAIAWLSGVSDRVAFAAAGRRLPGPPFAEELPPGVDDLSPRERRVAIEMLRVLVAQRQEIENAGTDTEEEQEPRTQARGPEHSGEARGDRRRPGAPMTRTTVTRLNRPQADVDFFSAEPQTSPHDAGRMPPPDQLTEEQILAARTTDDPSGIHHDTDK